MMKFVKGVLGATILGMLAAACSASADHSAEHVAESQSALTEVPCSYRGIQDPNGTTLPSASNGCVATEQTSADNTYGYPNCTDGYIWEITSLDSGYIPDRIFTAEVQPGSIPTNQSDCENTTVSMYLYGLDTVNDIPYENSCNVNDVAGKWWVDPYGIFASYCIFSKNTCKIDLDQWPNGMGTVSVNGIRLVGQAKLYGSKVTVKELISSGDGDWGSYCLH
jgi:hypothetical protein